MYYNIGIVCMMNINIGNLMTNYALHRFLTDCGYSTLMIDVPEKYKYRWELTWQDSFLELPYEKDVFAGTCLDKDDLKKLNDCCQMFLLGSDQLLRAMFIQYSNYYTCFDWVDGSKYKAAYATSFGIEYFEDNRICQRVKFYLNRFQKLSVREKSGVDLLKRQFGLNGDWVLDPTFLCDKKHYEKLAQRGESRLLKEKYVAAYLLDMEDFGKCVIRAAEKKCGVKTHLAILESQLRDKEGYSGTINTMPQAKVEEWLALIRNSEFVITDSFHGLCFSLIFQKNFIVIFDKECWRGNERFVSLLSLLHLTNRIVYSPKNLAHALELPDIDYSEVNAILKRERDRSTQWLIDTVHHGLHFEGQRVQETQLVLWGAGDCFARNYDRIRQSYPIQYVCDSDAAKWGTYPADGVLCISPEQLSALGDVFVLIAVDHPGVSLQITNLLLDMGIQKVDHIVNWV